MKNNCDLRGRFQTPINVPEVVKTGQCSLDRFKEKPHLFPLVISIIADLLES